MLHFYSKTKDLLENLYYLNFYKMVEWFTWVIFGILVYANILID